MSISTTSSFNATAQTIIDLALMDIGASATTGTQDPNLRTHALSCLNILLKSLDAEGARLGKFLRRTLPLVGGQASYVLDNDVQDVDQPARYVQAGLTTGSRVDSMSRDDYMAISDRTVTAPSTRYLTEKDMDANGIEEVTLTLWPTPSSTGDSLEYVAILRVKDVTTLAQTLDIPQKWIQCIRWGLAFNLAPAYGADVMKVKMLQNLHEGELKTCLDDDHEHGNLQISPYGATSNQWGR